MTYGYVYMLRCADGTLYTGRCKDLDERIKKHNSGKGAKYTRSRRPVKYAYYTEIASKSEALKLEKKIKSLSKAKKEALAQDFQKSHL